MSAIIETRNLSKRFGDFQAVKDLSFTILPGDIYGFLGQNGAGKSTTMRMILGLIYPDSGSIHIKGEVFNNGRRHLLRHIGAIIERPDMYGYLSGWDNLRMFASLSGMKIGNARLEELLELVSLKGREKDKVGAYSQGMKQRLGIAIALVHSPDLLILDEPTNGLDPQGISEMRQLIQSLSRDHGKTVLISSHLLHEMEQIATRMIIIHRGEKVVEGVVADLLNPDNTLVEVSLLPDETTIPAIGESAWQPFVKELQPGRITLQMPAQHVPGLANWLVAQGAAILQIRSSHSLEDYFLSLTHDTATPHRTL